MSVLAFVENPKKITVEELFKMELEDMEHPDELGTKGETEQG